MDTIFPDSLSRIAIIPVVGLVGTWKLSEFYHPPPGPLKDIGPKLVAELAVMSEAYVQPANLVLYASKHKLAKQEAVRFLEGLNQQTPSWWSLAKLLQAKENQELVENHLPTGSQLGARMRLVGKGDIMVRAPIDWGDSGHIVGQPPSDKPDWTWNQGTVFMALG